MRVCIFSFSMRVVLMFAVFMVVYSQTIEFQRKPTQNELITLNYKEKICRSEKTCHLIGTVNSSLHTMKERNCMCDENCTLYKDCCEDSAHINDHRTNKSEYFHCPAAERVYMKTRCPPNYPNQSIKWKCESSEKSLQNENKKLYIPVTNVRKNITYGNEYCAVCNNEFIYKAWNLSSHCAPLANKDPKSTTTTTERSESAQDAEAISPSKPGKFVDYYALNLAEAKKRIRFNETSKTFFSEYNGTKYDCWYSRLKPIELELHFRDCVSVISSCSRSAKNNGSSGSSNSTTTDLCETSPLSVVYDESSVAYKNIHCARCNNPIGDLRGCYDLPTKTAGSSIFTTYDKGNGQKPPCNNPKLKDKFC